MKINLIQVYLMCQWLFNIYMGRIVDVNGRYMGRGTSNEINVPQEENNPFFQVDIVPVVDLAKIGRGQFHFGKIYERMKLKINMEKRRLMGLVLKRDVDHLEGN